MRLALILFGALTGAVVIASSMMMWWNAPPTGLVDLAAGVILSSYVASPWVGAFLFAWMRPGLLRLFGMATGSVVGAALLGWIYYDSVFHPTSSTSALTLAVFPAYQWIALVGLCCIIVHVEKSKHR